MVASSGPGITVPVGHPGHTQQSMGPSGHEPMGGGHPSGPIGEVNSF